MPGKNILVIAVDGLRAGALGAYGNTGFPTPTLDQFAAESLVFDWCYADSVDSLAFYRALGQPPRSLLQFLNEHGYATTLVTDESVLTASEHVAGFHECVQLDESALVRAEEVPKTAIARLFAAASEKLTGGDAGRPRLVWVHSRGMYGPWDAPRELSESLLEREEGDSLPEDSLTPPDTVIDGTADPDAAFRWSCAYAAQVMALDDCFDGLLQTIESIGERDQWLVVLCGERGYPLGEHGRVGGVDGRLYAEQLHVPLVCRLPDGWRRLERDAGLVSLSDVPTAIQQFVAGKFQLPAREALTATAAAGIRSIRTADWSLRYDPAAAEAPTRDHAGCELFVRPDDRWEANDVAALCADETATLLARLLAKNDRIDG